MQEPIEKLRKYAPMSKIEEGFTVNGLSTQVCEVRILVGEHAGEIHRALQGIYSGPKSRGGSFIRGCYVPELDEHFIDDAAPIYVTKDGKVQTDPGYPPRKTEYVISAFDKFSRKIQVGDPIIYTKKGAVCFGHVDSFSSSHYMETFGTIDRVIRIKEGDGGKLLTMKTPRKCIVGTINTP